MARDGAVGQILDVAIQNLRPGDHIINTDLDVVGVNWDGSVTFVDDRTGDVVRVGVSVESLQVFRPDRP